MRDSFVLHAEYIEDLPEENKKEFLWYCYDYGINGIEPKLESFKKTVWIKIKRRIDADISTYETQKNNNKIWKAKSHYKNNRATEEEISLLESVGFLGSPKNNRPYTDTNTHSVSVSDIDTVIDNDIDTVIDTVIDNVNVNEHVIVENADSARKKYAFTLFNIFKAAGLPCNKNEINFLQGDFMKALPSIRGMHSNEVIEACKNYVAVLNNPECYVTSKMGFASLVTSKLWEKLQPEYFDLKSFQNTQNAKNDNFDEVREENKLKPPTMEELCQSMNLTTK